MTDDTVFETGLAPPPDNDRLLSLLESQSHGVYSWAPRIKCIWWSPKLKQTLGFDHDDHINIDWIAKKVHPDDIAMLTEAVTRSRRSKEPYRAEIRLQHAAGHYLNLELRGDWSIRDDGTPTLTGFVLDISELVESRNAAQASEARFKDFFDQCPAAVYIKDSNYRHLYVNPVAAVMAGADVNTVIGKTADELFEPQTAEKLRKVDDQVLRDKKTITWTGPTKSKSGGDAAIFDTKFPIVDHLTGETLICGFGIDISAERAAQEKLEQQQRVETLGLFVGGVAHDFNNQLATIRISADMLGLNCDGNISAELLAIQKATDMGARLCRQLLDYVGEANDPIETIRIDWFMEEIENILRLSLPPKQKLILSIAPTEAVASRTGLEQILINLLMNASRASLEEGTITIEVAEIPWPAEDEFNIYLDWSQRADQTGILIRVKDAGLGMDSMTLKKIFDPFFTTSESGHGLGLSAVLGIVKSFNGAIGVTSELGTGTEMSIMLPSTESGS